VNYSERPLKNRMGASTNQRPARARVAASCPRLHELNLFDSYRTPHTLPANKHPTLLAIKDPATTHQPSNTHHHSPKTSEHDSFTNTPPLLANQNPTNNEHHNKASEVCPVHFIAVVQADDWQQCQLFVPPSSSLRYRWSPRSLCGVYATLVVLSPGSWFGRLYPLWMRGESRCGDETVLENPALQYADV
jgi:hypothetical protein